MVDDRAPIWLSMNQQILDALTSTGFTIPSNPNIVPAVDLQYEDLGWLLYASHISKGERVFSHMEIVGREFNHYTLNSQIQKAKKYKYPNPIDDTPLYFIGASKCQAVIHCLMTCSQFPLMGI